MSGAGDKLLMMQLLGGLYHRYNLTAAARVHVLAAVYGGAGLDLDENHLHCQLYTENK